MKTPTFTYDRYIVLSVATLLGFGLVMVTSASMVIADQLYHNSLHYCLRQASYLLLGIAIIWLLTRVPLIFWQKYSLALLLSGIVLLFLVLIPGISHVINGSRRWLHLGFFSIQVSEVIKFLMIIYMARYLVRFQEQLKKRLDAFVKPIIILAIIAGLLLLEPDFGSTVVLSITVMLLLFIAGVRLWPLVMLLMLSAGAMSALAIFSPYRWERLVTFADPWRVAFGSGYQLTQSLMAFGRGGLTGVGLGNSVQKLFYLPEAHTDFIFAVIGEELGLLGEFCLITVFTILVVRILMLAKHAHSINQFFASFLCYGLACWLSLQILINIGVSTGLLPTKGLTLPFISYGGSSLLINCAIIGILLRISHELTLCPQPKKY